MKLLDGVQKLSLHVEKNARVHRGLRIRFAVYRKCFPSPSGFSISMLRGQQRSLSRNAEYFQSNFKNTHFYAPAEIYSNLACRNSKRSYFLFSTNSMP